MSRYSHLVIVDDNTDLTEILKDTFTETFSKITVFSEAKKAYDYIVASTDCSAIITDVNMPNLTGDQLIRDLRGEGVQTPVFFLTGSATKELVLTALRLGVADVFEKPLSGDLLVKSVVRVLEIEKRKGQLILKLLEGTSSPEEIHRMKKILSLLQIVNESQKPTE